MNLYDQWKELGGKKRSPKEHNEFWEAYFEKEKENYQSILGAKASVIEGTISELAERFQMEPRVMVGFLDGINTSLVNEIDLESLTEDSQIKLEIDFEKLYFNMLDAKADWLYNLPEWEDIFTVERRAEIAKEFRKSKIAVSNKVGRNEPCPCGSGKKYKACCGVAQ